MILVALSIAAFLAAAKAHGRQLRLERELAGYWQVTFGASNPPFVEALWRRERFLFWGTVVVVELFSLALRGLAPSPLLHLLLPAVSAFTVTGFLSLGRLVAASRRAVNLREGWMHGAMWGSVLWWSITFLLIAMIAWQR